MSKNIRHPESGEAPLTIRRLLDLAEREGWDPDTKLFYNNDELMTGVVVQGARLVQVVVGEGDFAIELDGQREDDRK